MRNSHNKALRNLKVTNNIVMVILVILKQQWKSVQWSD